MHFEGSMTGCRDAGSISPELLASASLATLRVSRLFLAAMYVAQTANIGTT
jgi:hypothetical protein